MLGKLSKSKKLAPLVQEISWLYSDAKEIWMDKISRNMNSKFTKVDVEDFYVSKKYTY